jgi:hypothetical protein
MNDLMHVQNDPVCNDPGDTCEEVTSPVDSSPIADPPGLGFVLFALESISVRERRGPKRGRAATLHRNCSTSLNVSTLPLCAGRHMHLRPQFWCRMLLHPRVDNRHHHHDHDPAAGADRDLVPCSFSSSGRELDSRFELPAF